MKKSILIALLGLLVISTQAQNKSGLETKILLRYVNKAKNCKIDANNTFVSKFNLQKNENGVVYVGVVAKVSPQFSNENLEKHGICIGSRIRNIVSMRVPLNKLSLLENDATILQYDIARRVYKNCNNTRFDTRVDSVQNGLGLPSAFTGKDVLVGITDWGFDYTHPNFYDTLRRDYRVYKVWDQFKTSGPTPAGFTYGTEFGTKEELLAAQCDTSNIYDYATHATHVAGIVGGSGAGTAYRGMAPDVQYMFVSFLLDEAAALDAFAWFKNQAAAANKRLVVNMSWGMYCFGTLDGTSLLSQAMDAYSEDDNIVFVSSAGNNGDVDFHIKKIFTTTDTLRTIVNFYNSVGEGISLWGNIGGSFKVGLAFSNNDTICYTPFFNTNSTNAYTDTMMVIGSDTITYDVAMESANVNNNRPHAFINVSTSAYNVHLFVTASVGDTVHAWNVFNKENHAGNTGVAFVSDGRSGYVNGDHYYGLSEPTTARSCISVASHYADRYAADSTINPGNVAVYSSYGPTLTMNDKPDISAPGSSVISSMSSFTTEQFTANRSVFYRGRMYKFATLSGTSMASPAVAGIVALMLQANPALTPAEVRRIIIETARNDARTGDLSGTCDLHWGHGKIDALAAVKKALETAEIKPVIEKNNFKIFPNPAKDFINVQGVDNHILTLRIFSADGKILTTEKISQNSKISVSHFPAGLYILQIESQGDTDTYKLLITK